MICIGLDNVGLSFGTDVVFEKVSFSLNDGEKLGIVGSNGAGKSTLLRIIAGEYEPDEGSVYISKDKTVGYLAQHNEYNSERSVFDELLSAFSDLINMEKRLEEIRKKAEEGDYEASLAYPLANERFIERGGLEYKGRCRGVLLNLGFTEDMFDTRVSTLSGGQKERLALASILIREPDVIILDEPNNHLDIRNIEWLEKFLSQTKKTVILVSHDRYFLSKVTTKTLEISGGRAKLYNGGYDKYVEQKKKDEEAYEKLYRTQQKEIERLEAIIEQQKRWNREKNIIKAEATQKRIDRMEKLEAPQKAEEAIRMRFNSAIESGNDVLTLRSLSKAYGSKVLFDKVDYEVFKNDRVVIVGPNGCGKSTLLKILSGYVKQDSGGFFYGYNVVMGYYDQENQNLNPYNTVLDELWNAYPNLTQTEIRNTLALFLFKGDDIEKPISVLSGGEKARLSLAKIILSKINLLILDEPTNHLDIMSMEVLENALSLFEGTIIAVSHDRYFIKKLATRILAFRGSELFGYEGGYDDYLEYTEKYLAEQKESGVREEKDSKKKYLESKQVAAEKRKNERRIAALKKEAEDAEAELEKLTLEAETSAATDHVRLSEIYERSSYLEERLLEIWAELEEADA